MAGEWPTFGHWLEAHPDDFGSGQQVPVGLSQDPRIEGCICLPPRALRTVADERNRSAGDAMHVHDGSIRPTAWLRPPSGSGR